MVPKVATRKQRLQNFIGTEHTFRIAFLKKAEAVSRKHVLHYVDFAEMVADTMPFNAFADSRGPESTPFRVNVPAWSPDGRNIAYEIGTENQTVNAVSRIYIQPLPGTRKEGPVFLATNPRWWATGSDTSLIWSTSGREDGFEDTAARTLEQKWRVGVLDGSPAVLSRGRWQGGLLPDRSYLASAFRHGAMLELATGTRRNVHIYPGHPPAHGFTTDSLQACNPSISSDPKRPSRMLYLDFGVPAGLTPYPNFVKPPRYAQHQMILIGDFRSEAPGCIVDFVATTRDPEGDKTKPDEPKPTQPEIYIIHLPTKSALKAVSGDHMIMPVLWIGTKP